MTKDEALKMAIEALINSLTIQDVAINACQEALEQPKEKKYIYAYIDTRFGKIAFSTEWDKNSEMPLIGKIEVQNE